MIVRPGSELKFTTSSDDYGAVVVGPDGKKDVEEGKSLPTDTKGFYALSVIDRQNRTLEVVLKGPHGQPSRIADTDKGRVTLNYRVEV